MANTDRMREEFEEWVKGCKGIYGPNLARDGEDYILSFVRLDWEVWQAACRAQAERDAEICRELAISSRHSAYGDDCAEAIRKEAVCR